MTLHLHSVGKQVRTRREELGLSQVHLAKLAELSRQTVQGLEAGSLQDLGFERVGRLLDVLGLGFENLSLTARQHKRGLWMAAKTAGVSYGKSFTEELLAQVLATGQVPTGYEAHVGHLLDEAPISLIVMAVKETAAQEGASATSIWRNVGTLARDYSDTRQAIWL